MGLATQHPVQAWSEGALRPGDAHRDRSGCPLPPFACPAAVSIGRSVRRLVACAELGPAMSIQICCEIERTNALQSARLLSLPRRGVLPAHGWHRAMPPTPPARRPAVAWQVFSLTALLRSAACHARLRESAKRTPRCSQQLAARDVSQEMSLQSTRDMTGS